ncbi:NAD(+) kinase [Gilvimarinus agarilyticus]|uniref:NAD(+) kinase n=1 Tax=Gilvimarinus sp. 2_MG-2023 TaxID=3062666 RepID=UPI001C0864D4|nr:NAD(+) kinase [Gilvimarinus sp. 2_MG-2023]MBU2887148.1 NAD(+) kinase [Gilvimarinus agarilyticus]MDO6571807.1 NAD(+) kinase [Gilvimarinus sp. 2_MG-2023]
MSQFSRIGLIGRLDNDRAKYTVRRLIEFLETCDVKVYIDEQTGQLINVDRDFKGVSKVAMPELGANSDLAIVVGGDGSLLSGARDLVEYNVPILGINRGRLGFLTDIVPDDIEQKITEVLTGEYVQEQRFMLDMRVERCGETVCRGDALNDVVLHPGEFIRMLEFELYVDKHFVTSQRSDGMIVSTPTGSTAYALSGGGPIMHPKLDAIGLVPMNPHTLSSRPMVVPGGSLIEIVVGEGNSAIPQVTCDGQTHDTVQGGDKVIITKKPQTLQLIHPVNHNFYERCRSKLGWGGHLLERS